VLTLQYSSKEQIINRRT